MQKIEKVYLIKGYANTEFKESSEPLANYIAVSKDDMKMLEDQQRYIDKLQQILREKNNRELKIRPPKKESGYVLQSVAIDTRYRPSAKNKTVTAYRVKITTPWLLKEMDMEMAKKMWENDAEWVCKEWGLEYYLKSWNAVYMNWETKACAINGMPEANFNRKCFMVTFYASKPPKWIKESGDENEGEWISSYGEE